MASHPVGSGRPLLPDGPVWHARALLATVLAFAAACSANVGDASQAGACRDCTGAPVAGDTGGDRPPEVGVEEDAPCAEGAAEGVDVGDCAPDFSLPDRDGRILSLSSLRGAPIVIEMVMMW